ncbi:MAG: hypothetical protein AAFU77_13330 [Myxococcota bacterium]
MFRTTIAAAVIALSTLAFSAPAQAAPSAQIKNPATAALKKHRKTLKELQQAHTTRMANAQRERMLFWRVVRPVDVVPSTAVASR